MQVETSDSVEFLKKIDDYGLDIIYCDPPYALGSEIIIRADGKVDYSKASDFMDKWSMPDGYYWESWFKEAFRSLKYGGRVIMFGMDRQLLLFKYYAKLAGFQETQSLYWFFISNFPKASDLSKMIDKNLGEEREIKNIKERKGNPINTNVLGNERPWMKEQIEKYGGLVDIETIPSSELAKKYEGYKYSISALKQTNETIMVFQKPTKTGSPLHDTLAYENGDNNISVSALNIDGNRVETTEDLNYGKTPRKNISFRLSQGNEERPKYDGNGRYPAQTFIDSQTAEILDKQSGVSKSAKTMVSDDRENYGNSMFIDGVHNPQNSYDDIGGCSKILHKCDYDKEDYDLYYYNPKVGVNERNKGLDSYITLKHNIDKEIIELCQEENMEVVELLKRVMLECQMGDLNIERYGENIMVRCHKDSLYTTLTEINKITELKILNSLMHSLTKDCTQIVNCEMENGGKSVLNVENINELIKKIGIGQTKVNGSLILGVASAIYRWLLTLKERKKWNDYKNIHCTLKPIALNEKILKLFKTPNDQKICYAFAGAGSEIIGGIKAGFDNWIACEINKEYVDIANARIKYWKETMTTQLDMFSDLDNDMEESEVGEEYDQSNYGNDDIEF